MSRTVAESMAVPKPDITVHLGDVYYVGLPNEVEENCCGKDTKQYRGVTWPSGTKGSLALNGNHEMYSGGPGYFENFLPNLGIPSSQDQKQLRSYFRLETPAWRVLAIDTGYNSDILFGQCKLETVLLDWLKNVIDPVNNRKPTVLLSHHQWFSGFGDGDYKKPADQVAQYFPNQDIIWLWGHEHRLVIYNKYADPNNGLRAWGRCIGHGGMPIELAGSEYPNGHRAERVEYWDGDPARFQPLNDGTLAGTNGYADMVIQGSTLTLEYRDADGLSVLKESFVPGGGAAWDGNFVRTVLIDPKILSYVVYPSADPDTVLVRSRRRA
jgi:hypothetical protein